MADAQSNIQISIDTTDALASIKNLQRQISAFHSSLAKGGAAANAVSTQLQQTLINSVNATGQFSASIKTIRTTTESFTSALEKNKFSLGEYFRYAGGATKTFGRLFKTEQDTINKVARENVKDLQTQYIRMGRDASGAMKAIAVRPLALDMTDLGTRTQIAAQKQAIMNQLLKQGSTNLLNFGKNTQWAGRQLMVGFTLPLIALGSAASKTFMDMETQAIRFKKVYGDLFTPQEESAQALKDIQDLGKEFTKYGIAVSTTVGLAAEAAAAGFQGLDLQRQTAAATKLSILGQVESQKALETTISLQNAFAMSSENLAESIDFLNAVENQTVLSLDDVSTAIPKAAPIVQQLGGDVKDLAFFMTAMKEGGINASEGANALKSGLASIINPTGKAAAMLESFGINVKKIVVDNKGDLKKTVIEFATALNQLDPLNRAQAIEQLFGKFQFSRLSTLFANVTQEGTQAARVLDLAGASVQELAALSEKELGMTSESAMNKFKGAVENLKVALVPLGEEFLKAATPIAEFITKIIDKFNNLSDNTKKIIVTITAVVAGLGPVFLMTFGLLANGIANIIKGFTFVKTLFDRTGRSTATLGTQVEYMTTEQRNAAAVAASLDQIHVKLSQTFTSEAAAVNGLTQAYQRAIAAQSQFIPVAPPLTRGPVKKFASGKPAVVGGTGNKDSELALLMPGETVIPTRMSKKYGGLINAMIADEVPGYKRGLPKTGTAVDIPGGFAAAHFGGSSYRTGAELLSMVEGLDTAFARQIRTMVAEVEGGLDRLFTVFTNEVTATSTELNRAVGKTGSGKTAPIALAKQDLIGSGAATRDIELQRQLEQAGVPIEEIRSINQKVTDSIEAGFKKLGDKAVVTAEELDKLVDDAYAEVAKTDDRVRAARTRMREVTAVTDPRTDSRVPISKDPYTKFRKSGAYYAGMERSVGAENVPYTRNARFKITNPMAAQIGLSSRDAALVYNQFSKEVKIRLASLKGDVAAFSAEFAKEAEKAGIKTGNAYKIGLDKVAIADPYIASRDRKSPHAQASKDGRDDARAYATARDKEATKQSKRRRVATRLQGPPTSATAAGSSIVGVIPGGPATPPNTSPTPKGPSRFTSIAKGAGNRLNSMGGGVGLLGLNMGLSMTPDFAGKGIAQGALAGANLGMFFGPQGMALGATIGAVTSAFTGLIAKQKEHAAITKSTFTVSNSLITAFGDKVLDTKIKVTELSNASLNLRDKFGLLSPEVQAIIDDLKKLPEDDPISLFIKNISKQGQSLNTLRGNMRSQVTTAIAIGGLDPANAQKYVYALMEAAGRANEFGAVWKSISKDVIDSSTATEASFSKLGDAVNQAGGSFTFLEGPTGNVAKDYDELRDSAKNLADQMFSFFGVLSNGALTYDQIQERLQAFTRSSVDAKTGVLALQASIKASGDDALIERFALIERIIKESGKAATATAADYTMMHLALEMLAAQGKNLDSLRTDLFPDEGQRALARRYATDSMLLGALMKGKDFKDYVDNLAAAREEINKIFNNNDYKDYEDGTDGISAASKAYLKILDKEIQGLERKRDAQKTANDEIQRQIDLETKLKDLAKEGVLAKISGDYIKAASIQQQAQNVQMEFNLETELRKKDAEIARLKNRAEDISGGAPLTKAEAAKIPNKKKAASGGMIRGAGTGTSDSIPAYLSNGEYVIKAKSVKKYGTGFMDKLNAGRFADGGLIQDPNKTYLPDGVEARKMTRQERDANYRIGRDRFLAQRKKYKDFIMPQETNKELINRLKAMGYAEGGLVKDPNQVYLPDGSEARKITRQERDTNYRTSRDRFLEQRKKYKNFVMPQETNKELINRMKQMGYAMGGLVPRFADGGLAKNNLISPKDKSWTGLIKNLLKTAPLGPVGIMSQFKTMAGAYKQRNAEGEIFPTNSGSAVYVNIHDPAKDPKQRSKNSKPLMDALQMLSNETGLQFIPVSSKDKVPTFSDFIDVKFKNNNDKGASAGTGEGGALGQINLPQNKDWAYKLPIFKNIPRDLAAHELIHILSDVDKRTNVEGVDWGHAYGSDPYSLAAYDIMQPKISGMNSYIARRDILSIREKFNLDNKQIDFSQFGQINLDNPIKKSMGGLIKGPGTGTSDSIRATLGYAGGGQIRVSDGEFVVKASSVKDYGVAAMNAVNNGTATISTNSGGTVYNINMPITSNNANAEGVANEVIRKLKLEVSKNNKSNKVGL
jgi:TP901 family phage tail tape measure protein